MRWSVTWSWNVWDMALAWLVWVSSKVLSNKGAADHQGLGVAVGALAEAGGEVPP